jgi:tetratricopeptide (TPR) repeat protein
VAELRNQPQKAIDALRKAIAVDERDPPVGPAGAVTARERMGELLLRQHRPADALKEFRQSLDLRPRRSRSLLGAARAASSVDREAARDYWAQLAANWSKADPDTQGLTDARAALDAPR